MLSFADVRHFKIYASSTLMTMFFTCIIVIASKILWCSLLFEKFSLANSIFCRVRAKAQYFWDFVQMSGNSNFFSFWCSYNRSNLFESIFIYSGSIINQLTHPDFGSFRLACSFRPTLHKCEQCEGDINGAIALRLAWAIGQLASGFQ